MHTLHHLTTTLLIPTLTCIFKVWWTGASHIVDNMNPTYNWFARHITGLLTHTRSDKLLSVAGLQRLTLRLNSKIRRYGIGFLLSPNDHPNEAIFRFILLGGVSLGRIKQVLADIIPQGTRLEIDICPNYFMPTCCICIHAGTKEKVAALDNICHSPKL